MPHRAPVLAFALACGLITSWHGRLVGAVLDRNGLRPSRIWITADGLVVMASEAGVLNLDPCTVVKKMRLQPGRMFLVDTSKGRIVSDEEIKAELAAEQPYQEWLDAGLFKLDDLPPGDYVRMPHHRVVLCRVGSRECLHLGGRGHR